MVRRLILALAIVFSGTLFFSQLALAQGRPAHFGGSPGGMRIHFGPRGRMGRGFRGFHGRGRGRFGGGYAVYPYPYFWPDEGYGESYPPPSSSPTQIVVVPQPEPPAPASVPPPPSLMLEYRDGHWVRVPTGTEVPTTAPRVERATARSDARNARRARRAKALEAEETARPAPPLPDAVLVLRDGRKVQLHRYEIRDGYIYASGEYWARGSKPRKIAISALNVPATMRLNRQIGSKFQLPTNPDEIFVSF